MKVPKAPKRKVVDEGTHNAVCTLLSDLGTQPSNNPNWEDKRMLLIGFELVDETTEDGKPMFISKTYTFSDSPKGNLAKDLKTWLAVKSVSDFEIDSCLGKSALVTIVHNENDKGIFANISGISQPTKGSKVRRPQSELLSLYLDPKDYDEETFNKLPEWIRLKIAASPEFEAVAAPKKKSPKKEEEAPKKKKAKK